MAETWPGQLPVHAIEAGNEAFVVEEAESFAAAEPAEREIALAFVCDVGAVRRLTHEDPERTAMVLEIAQLLGARVGKDVNVNDVLQAMPGFFDDDRVRLVDRMADERLPAALEDLRSGRFDPVTAQLAGMPGFWGW